jgi:ubiquinone/menaquinone biosynthesis C-methylase UbiE
VLNIEAIEMPDASWDVVVANHVLEHVDDRKALSEIRRILVPGGFAIFSFPLALTFERTYENTAITSRAEALMVPPLPERGALTKGRDPYI